MEDRARNRHHQLTMSSKYLFVKRTSLGRRLLMGGALLALILILWPSVKSSVNDAGDFWSAPVEPPGTVIVTQNTALSLSAGQPKGSDSNRAQAVATANTVANSGAGTSITTTTTTHQAPLATFARAVTPEPQSEAALRRAIKQWRDAWTMRDLPTYLAFYSPNFEPPQGISRQAWADYRTARISSKQKIWLDFQNLTLQIKDSTATVRFTQVYADERFRAADRKTMVWQKRDGRWLIQRETTD